MTARFAGLVIAGDVPEGYDPTVSPFTHLWCNGNKTVTARKAAKGQLWEREAERDHREKLQTLAFTLVAEVGTCTCGAGRSGYQHEAYCGVEFIRDLTSYPSRVLYAPFPDHGIIHGKRAQ